MPRGAGLPRLLPSGVRRRLTPVEMDAYREPYHEPSARLLLWQWARSIAIAGEHSELVEAVAADQQYLRKLCAAYSGPRKLDTTTARRR